MEVWYGIFIFCYLVFIIYCLIKLKVILFDLIAHISLDNLSPVWNYTTLSFLAGILAIYFSAYITKKWGFENPIKIILRHAY